MEERGIKNLHRKRLLCWHMKRSFKGFTVAFGRGQWSFVDFWGSGLDNDVGIW